MSLTISEVGKKLGVHHIAVYWWCKQGILPATKISRGYLIEEEDITKFLETHGSVVKKYLREIPKAEDRLKDSFPNLF